MEAIVTAGGRDYAVTFDGTVRRQAFVTGALRDDADGVGIAREALLLCDERLLGTALSDSDYALTGDVQVALTDRSVPHALSLRISAAGYRPASATISVPAFSALPVRHDLGLRRMPADVRGRVLGKSAGPTPEFLPVAGAQITVSGPPGPGGELPLLLAQPLTFDLVAGANLRARALVPQPGLVALEPALAGDAFVALVDGSGVAAGTVLRFGVPGRDVWAEVAVVDAHPDRPAPAALAWLTEPLSGSTSAGSAIAAFGKGAFSGATATPVGTTYAGEALLWVDALPGAGDVLVLRQPGHPDRYHDRDVLSGPAGDYLIRGFARMGTAELRVGAAGFVTQTRSLPARRILSGPLDWLLVP